MPCSWAMANPSGGTSPLSGMAFGVCGASRTAEPKYDCHAVDCGALVAAPPDASGKPRPSCSRGIGAKDDDMVAPESPDIAGDSAMVGAGFCPGRRPAMARCSV